MLSLPVVVVLVIVALTGLRVAQDTSAAWCFA